MNLAEKVADLPLSPGVYLMKDSLGHIIYVGKAKQLKKRVQSYFHKAKGHSPKVKQLVRNIRDLDYRLTDTEFEAFMLECELIKEIKPMYNKKMKNPLAYSYIAIRTDTAYRQLAVTYDPAEYGDSPYFGPYTSRSTVERALQGIKESQKILCSTPHSKNAFCLNHSLGLCIGMCGGGEAPERYGEIMHRVEGLLNGNDHRILDELQRRMNLAAENFEFETAAKYRDYYTAVRALLQKEKVIGFTGQNKNIVVLESVNEQALKLILIQGSEILFRSRLEGTLSGTQLHAVIQSAITDCFGKPSSGKPIEISRHKLDEAQIIYSYLKSRSGSYALIPGEWLEAGNETVLTEAVGELIRSYSAGSAL
ncbi:UvrB/UvrC motif-containing protein [Paenibacillus sp. S150]|uniref:UvrB/UvrC motif-containing protein n=1 Tax=Paenibacillus sp. S150 TaxID=2749826 RepID=UPI001C58C18D|nr:UvrB/UvrC motif-containing protein [Paenibacillus sp. S150]MBW4084486.1 GIY-YIG nuclease family protein [Paenibacillus sp. S150]